MISHLISSPDPLTALETEEVVWGSGKAQFWNQTFLSR